MLQLAESVLRDLCQPVNQCFEQLFKQLYERRLPCNSTCISRIQSDLPDQFNKCPMPSSPALTHPVQVSGMARQRTPTLSMALIGGTFCMAHIPVDTKHLVAVPRSHSPMSSPMAILRGCRAALVGEPLLLAAVSLLLLALCSKLAMGCLAATEPCDDPTCWSLQIAACGGQSFATAKMFSHHQTSGLALPCIPPIVYMLLQSPSHHHLTPD